MKKIFSWFSRNKLSIVLFSIIAIGIFLRIYNFSDWVRFNDDQVRDALVIDRMISGEEFPLLGPKAGGTNFNLGPAFYYFEYFSALVFGNTPDVLAYPVLFFSILSIPLFYFVFRKIFNQNISLALTLIYSVSFFSVKYSRFAWNMNMVPFFLLGFIYLLDKFFNQKETKNIYILALGAVIGIGIQLHTLLLVCFPAIFVLFVLIDFLKDKNIEFKKIIAVFLITLSFNIPMAVYEVKTGGENFKAFLEGTDSKTEEGISVSERVMSNIKCQIQGSSFVVTGYKNDDDCGIFQFDDESGHIKNTLNIIFGICFFIVGVGIILFFLKRKKVFFENRIFLIMVSYFLISLIIFSLLSGEISLRMFTMIIFVPFLFLGLWVHVIVDVTGKLGKIFSIFLIAILSAANLFVFKGTYFSLGDMYRDDKYFGGVSLGEMENIADYMENNSESGKKVSISKFTNAKSLEYLLEKKGKNVEVINEDDKISRNSLYFYIRKNNFRIDEEKKEDLLSDIEKFRKLDSKIIGQYTVFKLESMVNIKKSGNE